MIDTYTLAKQIQWVTGLSFTMAAVRMTRAIDYLGITPEWSAKNENQYVSPSQAFLISEEVQSTCEVMEWNERGYRVPVDPADATECESCS